MDSDVEEAFPLAFINKMVSRGLAEAMLVVCGEINSLIKNFLFSNIWLLLFRNFSLVISQH